MELFTRTTLLTLLPAVATKLSGVFPGTLGGNWNPMSYDPRLGYLFINDGNS